MYKLLTQIGKARVMNEYNLRRWRVIISLISVLFIYIGVSLIPSIILARTKVDSATLALSTATPQSADEKKSLEVWIQALKVELTTLIPVSPEVRPYDLFQKVLTAKVAGIKINSLNLAIGEKGTVIKTAGLAKDRQALLAFKESLKNSNDWAAVDLPVSTLTKDIDIPFEFSLTPHQP